MTSEETTNKIPHRFLQQDQMEPLHAIRPNNYCYLIVPATEIDCRTIAVKNQSNTLHLLAAQMLSY